MNTRPGEKALAAAWNMIGRPYQYTGEGPEGFDCSGLVRYSYLSVGMDVPHATSELKEATRGIDYEELRKGDLVFFDRNGKKYGHVGIYAGDDRFIHAPRPGKSVRIDSLHNTYWKQRFSGARRFN
jgi:cell wall-associated NlpC family hydrolase